MKLVPRARFALPAILPFAAAFALAGCAGVGDAPIVTAAPAPVAAAPSGDLAALVEKVAIPYETFTLDNGLVTIVHTDRKAPIVGVTVYYRVGSRHEPRGKTGFAHLFEHVMFSGSENVENFDVLMEGAGSTPTNGSTWFDRTNYVETVPTGALETALFAEADRMGFLLGAVTQEALDTQRSVVQNEKRQGDSQPYGLVDYRVLEAQFPIGHPYRHSTIGSMADLEAASLADVHQWFKDNYGPNNAILVLAGDIDMATARPMVERWFGDIPRGPQVPEFAAEPVTLAAAINEEMTDQVPLAAIFRNWVGPGLNHADAVPLQVGMHILGGLASSRLDSAMVRGEEIAAKVSAYAQVFEELSLLQAQVDIKPGIDRTSAQALLEAEIAALIKDGPTQDELDRARTQLITSKISGLESVGGFGGKGMILAEGLLYTGSADFYRQELRAMAALTPQDVQGAMSRWLSRPAYNLTVLPGERTLDGAGMGGWGDEDINPPPAPDAGGAEPYPRTAPPRSAPGVEPVGELTFPEVQTAKLSNGISVVLARRDAIPKVSLAMTFDAGSAVDPVGEKGVHETMMTLLSEGTTSRSALDIAIEQEQLGSSISAGAGVDDSSVFLSTLTTNLAPSLELMADVVRNPAFAPGDVARVKEQRLAQIAQELASPSGLALRAMRPLIYGAEHPYAHASSSGDVAAIEAITPAAMTQEHSQWIRPDRATITAVGDVALNDLVAALEASFGNWQPPATPPPGKNVLLPSPAPAPRLVLVDRPNAPSTTLSLSRLSPLVGHAKDMELIQTANEVLGSGFLSRLMGDLRETKGWTYGISSGFTGAVGQRAFVVNTQVQADRTADSIRAILEQMAAFPATRPIADGEFQRVTDGTIRGLPNSFETNGQVLGALLANQQLGRDLRYHLQLPAIYRAMSMEAINQAAREYLQPDNLTIVVVGDRRVIDAQVQVLGRELGMDILTLTPEEL